MILVEATPEHFGIEQIEDRLYALSKCCGAHLSISETARLYACIECGATLPVFGVEDYPIEKYRDHDGWASVMTSIVSEDPLQQGNRWWISKWLEVPYEDVQFEIS